MKMTTQSFKEAIQNTKGLLVVDFWAEWCGPCKMVAPNIEKVSEECPDAIVGKINVNESPDLATKFGVKNIPTIMVFKNGSLVSKAVGYHSEEDLLAMIQ